MSAEVKISVPGLFAAAGAGIAFSVIDMAASQAASSAPRWRSAASAAPAFWI